MNEMERVPTIYDNEWMGNFFCRFPSAGYRQSLQEVEDELHKCDDGAKKQMDRHIKSLKEVMHVIDHLILAMKFDLTDFEAKYLERDRRQDEYCRLFNSGKVDEAKKYSGERDITSEILEMVRPIYVAMRMMGFSQEQLTA
jgi:hypothetical protein